MEQRLLLILMSCGIYWDIGMLNPYKHIYFVNQPKTFDEAQQYCRDNYEDLLTLWDQAEMEAVFAQENFTTPFAWIGLKRSSHYQWLWALDDQDFYKEGETEYINWGSGEPNNGKAEYCSVMDDRGHIRDTTCWVSRIFICYNGQNNTKSNYIFIDVPKPWRAAQRHCREFYTDLASVRNQDENLQIQQLIPPTQVAYIGLYRDPYVWSDNSTAKFRNWDFYQPDVTGDCVVQQLRAPRLWDDQSCSYQYPFFCHTIPVLKQVLRLEVKSDENVNPNGPVMQAIILQVIQQKLISQGLSGQTSVHWRQQPNGDVFQRTRERAASLTLPRAACPQYNHY